MQTCNPTAKERFVNARVWTHNQGFKAKPEHKSIERVGEKDVRQCEDKTSPTYSPLPKISFGRP